MLKMLWAGTTWGRGQYRASALMCFATIFATQSEITLSYKVQVTKSLKTVCAYNYSWYFYVPKMEGLPVAPLRTNPIVLLKGKVLHLCIPIRMSCPI